MSKSARRFFPICQKTRHREELKNPTPRPRPVMGLSLHDPQFFSTKLGDAIVRFCDNGLIYIKTKLILIKGRKYILHKPSDKVEREKTWQFEITDIDKNGEYLGRLIP